MNGEVVNISIPENIVAPLLKSEEFISPRFPYYIGKFAKNSPAKDAGLEAGDKIVAVNGRQVEFFDQFVTGIAHLKDTFRILTGNQSF